MVRKDNGASMRKAPRGIQREYTTRQLVGMGACFFAFIAMALAILAALAGAR